MPLLWVYECEFVYKYTSVYTGWLYCIVQNVYLYLCIYLFVYIMQLIMFFISLKLQTNPEYNLNV